MSLQNSLQQKQFTAGRTSATKQARTKSFYVAARRPEKKFPAGAFRTKSFSTRSSRHQGAEANVSARSHIAKRDALYPTRSYAVATAAEVGQQAKVSQFSGTRAFLIKGKSQKALSQQDRPLTIDEVRELLNKNK